MKKIKAHPAMILRAIFPVFFVALLPVARRIVFSITNKNFGFMLVVEIVVFLMVVVFAVFNWKSYEIIVSEDSIVLKRGVLRREKAEIGRNGVAGITLTANPVFWLVGAATLRIETECRKDFSVIVHRKSANAVLSEFREEKTGEEHKISAKRVLFFAAATSSAAVGLLFTAPVVNRIGKLLNIALAEKLIGTITQTAQGFGRYISPVAGVLSLVLIGLYVVSFAVNLLKVIFMRVGFSEDHISIRCGILPRRHVVLKKSAINNVIAESTPLMRFLGSWQVRVSAAHYGGGKTERMVLLPTANRQEQEKVLTRLIGESETKNILSSPRFARRRFIRWYVLAFVALFPLFLALIVRTDYLFDLFVFLAAIIVVIMLYLIDLAVYNHKNGGILFLNSGVITRSVKHFSFRRVFFRHDRVAALRIRRYPADKKAGTCTVKFFAKSRRGESAKVKFIDYSAVCEYYRKLWEN